MDVAAVLEALIAQPVMHARAEAAAGGALDKAAIAWLGAFAFLHDVGKVSPAFQAKAWPDPHGPTRSHLSEGAVWWQSLMHGAAIADGAAAALLVPLAEAGQTACAAWFEVLLGHHGRPIDFLHASKPPDPRRPFPDRPGYDWRAEDRRMGRALRDWFPAAAIDPALLRRPRLAHHFAGLLALADWIGSDADLFPHRLPFDPGYADHARKRAAEALRRIGLADAAWPATAPTFADLTGHAAPRGPQAAMGAVPPDARLVVLEAETGSGKTEAALLRFACLRSEGRVDALYFAVPTRAAAGQLCGRVDAAMSRVGGPEAVLAVPGQLRAGGATGVHLPGYRVEWDDDLPGADSKRHWAAEQATRFLAAPVAVGTVDQALIAGLRVKHAPMRASALSRSLLVIDEVHASDPYMNAVARALVEGHLALGGHVLLMSATLGSPERARWLGTPPPDPTTAVAAPYPAVWHSRAPGAPITPGDGSPEKAVAPRLVETMDDAAAARRALDAAAAGARVLVIRNTVDAARATWAAAAERAPDLCLAVADGPALHHSRFAAEDRRLLDRAVEAALGRHRRDPGRGVVVVGTQTLEQSLDIDADLLVTDLCPMDALLQRIGRLHRHHGRDRPTGFGTARVDVLSPEGGLDRLAVGPSFENGLGAWTAGGGWSGIYMDLRGLELTRRMVRDEDRWSIPRDNRRLVEGATHAEHLAAVEAEMGWGAYGQRIDAKGLAEGQAGGMVTLDRAAPFPSAFPDVDEAVQTRLGDRGPVLSLPEGTVGPFGEAITCLALPAHWSHGLAGDEVPTVAPVEGGLRLGLADRSFFYGRGGLGRGADP